MLENKSNGWNDLAITEIVVDSDRIIYCARPSYEK